MNDNLIYPYTYILVKLNSRLEKLGICKQRCIPRTLHTTWCIANSGFT